MNNVILAAALLCPVWFGAAVFLFLLLERSRRHLRTLEILQAAQAARMEEWQEDEAEVKELRARLGDYLEQKSIALTQMQETEKKLQGALAERMEFLQQREQAFAERAAAEQQLALMHQHMQDAEKRMQDWESQRAESMKDAKAVLFEMGGQLSGKLMEDHKREAEAAKKQAEEAAKRNAETLLEQMHSVTKSVAAIQAQSVQTQDKMATVWRALTTPAGAGQLSEIALENTLKNLGLEAGRDFSMQHSMSGETGRLRPDAVIFLPQDMVMVIDSKASKFLLQIAEAEAKGEDSDQLLKGLAQTMNKHLDDLKNKDYEAAIRAAYRESGRPGSITATHMVMYVPSESAIAHLKRADGDFMLKAEKRGIIIASPASLMGLLSLAKHNIGQMRQSENHERIITGVQQLMDNIVNMLTYAEKMGKGIKSAADGFDQFSRSVNRNVLSKMRQLAAYGIASAKNKEIPARLIQFEVRIPDDSPVIEAEAETIEDASVIEDFSKAKRSA